MDILDTFIEQAQQNVKTGYYDKYVKPQTMLKHVSLKDTLQVRDFSLIAEIKHASPAGEYAFEFIDVQKKAQLFKENGANAISVVVEPAIFKGKLEHITLAKQADLPVLFKDFVLDVKQIETAANLGADCVLLIMKVMNRLDLNVNEFIDYAHELGIEVLLECYTSDEMTAAFKTKADSLGINNRNLETLKVDLNCTEKILKETIGEKINKPVISESGVKTKADAEFLKQQGAKGILVGTALWKADNLKKKIHELTLKGFE